MQVGPTNMQAGPSNMQAGTQAGPPNMQAGPPNMQFGPRATAGMQFVTPASQMQQSAPSATARNSQHTPVSIATTETAAGPQATAEEQVGTPQEEESRDKGEFKICVNQRFTSLFFSSCR